MTPHEVAVIALTGLVLIVAVVALIADRSRRRWAARCAVRRTERDQLSARIKTLVNQNANVEHRHGRALDQRDAAHDLIADMLPHLKHAGMSPMLKRRAADLLDGS